MTTVITFTEVKKYRGFRIEDDNYPRVYHGNGRKMIWEALDMKSAMNWIDEFILWCNL